MIGTVRFATAGLCWTLGAVCVFLAVFTVLVARHVARYAPEARGIDVARMTPEWPDKPAPWTHEVRWTDDGEMLWVLCAPARHGTHGVFDQREWRVYTVLNRRDLRWRGCSYRLNTSDENVRAATLRTYEHGVATQLYDLARHGQGEEAPLFTLEACRTSRWRDVLSIIQTLRGPMIEAREFHFRVWHPPRPVGRVFAAVLETLEDGGPTPTVATLQCRLDRRVEDDTAVVELAIGEERWTFPGVPLTFPPDEMSDRELRFYDGVPDPYADPDFNIAANRIWDDVVDYVWNARAGKTSARLEVPHAASDLWYAYPVKVIDLCLGAGIRKIDFPDAGFRMTLEPPAPKSVDPTSLLEAPVLTPWALGGSLLAIALALWITLLAYPRRRRNRGMRG
jgi:hypothetical protein